jgi:cytochrome c556
MWLLLLACAPHPRDPVAVEPPHVSSIVHAADALAARDAIVNADYPRFAEAITRLTDEFPLAGAGHDLEQAAVVDALGRARAAIDLPQAARALGEVGEACGACHVAAGARLAAPEITAPTGDGVRPEMARHDRALALVWSGLVRPAQADLDAGAAAFAASSLQPVGTPAPAAATVLDDSVTRLASAVAKATTPADRAARFGDVLGTCAACHNAPPSGLGSEPD